MSDFRLYRRIYQFVNETGTYTLIAPSSISALTRISGDTTTVESITPTNESTGIYYAGLNPEIYNDSSVYELLWTIIYVSGSASKTLSTYFKFTPETRGSDIMELHLVEESITLSLLEQPIILQMHPYE